MTWVRMDDARAINGKLREAGFEARGLDEAAIEWSASQEHDGFISDADVEMLAALHGCKKVGRLTTVLVKVGRWTRDDERGGWWITNFLEFNPSRAELEAKRESDRKRKRSRAGIRGESEGIPVGIHEDSEGIPVGIHEDSEGIPVGIHEDSERSPDTPPVPPVPPDEFPLTPRADALGEPVDNGSQRLVDSPSAIAQIEHSNDDARLALTAKHAEPALRRGMRGTGTSMREIRAQADADRRVDERFLAARRAGAQLPADWTEEDVRAHLLERCGGDRQLVEQGVHGWKKSLEPSSSTAHHSASTGRD